jgi:hypothetical protein
MTTDIDRVWLRMKDIAKRLAQQDAMPSVMHARGIIGQLIREERASSTPPEACEYLAAELRRMVGENKSAQVSQAEIRLHT